MWQVIVGEAYCENCRPASSSILLGVNVDPSDSSDLKRPEFFITSSKFPGLILDSLIKRIAHFLANASLDDFSLK